MAMANWSLFFRVIFVHSSLRSARLFSLRAHTNFISMEFNGRVGASWMTKDERLVDIANQREYLSSVFRWIEEKAPHSTIHCIGFSQGVATIMRCIGHQGVLPASLLAWAGSWPPDLDKTNRAALNALTFKAWFGTQDEYINTEKQEQMVTHYREKYNFEPMVGIYEGGHSFDAEKLAREITALEK